MTIICNYKHESLIQRKIKLRFKNKKDSKSKAHHIAKNVARGNEKENLELKDFHLRELKEIIKRNVASKVG